MAEQRTILIADDHPIFRSGVRQSLEKQSDIRIIGEAENGEDALTMILDLKPDVAILDIQMPKMTGLELAHRAERLNLGTKIVLLTMVDDRKIFLDAIECGVMGYVLKDSAVAELHRAVASVCSDRHYVSPSLSGLLVERRKQGTLPTELGNLTPAELQILRLIADLKSNQEIADELAVSKRTVENHRVNISRKLNLTGSNAILRFALKHKAEM